MLTSLEDKYRFLFLTLTVRNCTKDKLSETIDSMMAGWNRFLGLKKIEGFNKGYIRSLEMTYNKKDDTYHPHIHALICVESNYFTDEALYLKHEDLINLWQKSAQLDYQPNVRIEILKEKRIDRKAYIETLKYSIKPQPEVEGEQLLEYITKLKGRRLISFGGIVKKLRKLNLDDLNDIEVDEKPRKVLAAVIMRMDVNAGVYRTEKIL